MSAAGCIFCRIAAGEIPADVVLQDERVVAFRDVNPQAPVHILVVPREHIPSAVQLAPEHDALWAAVLHAAQRVARQEGIEDGHRLVVNVGEQAGQTVHHLHLHLLGGRPMRWPPG